MLDIKNLHSKVADTDVEILRGLNLKIAKGEVCAIMGPNGSGKSTLANVIAGNPEYEVVDGSVIFENQELIEETPNDRANRGIFMAFQYPAEIPGVKPWQFLKASLDSKADFNKTPKLSVGEFSKLFDEATKKSGLPKQLAQRSLNVGLSGGEKKRAEIMQMLVLQPKMIILDETDSGLDVDALKMVGEVINSMKSSDRSFLIVTHYHRILDHINPDTVHVLANGQIVQSGGPELALEIEKNGYKKLIA